MKPCKYCGGTNVIIEGKGQLWRGVKGYGDPQYWMLQHWGQFSGDDFVTCNVSFRCRTEIQAAELWDQAN